MARLVTKAGKALMRHFGGVTTAKLFPCSLKTRDLGSMTDKFAAKWRGIF
jgi:hypothetical protein